MSDPKQPDNPDIKIVAPRKPLPVLNVEPSEPPPMPSWTKAPRSTPRTCYDPAITISVVPPSALAERPVEPPQPIQHPLGRPRAIAQEAARKILSAIDADVFPVVAGSTEAAVLRNIAAPEWEFEVNLYVWVTAQLRALDQFALWWAAHSPELHAEIEAESENNEASPL